MEIIIVALCARVPARQAPQGYYADRQIPKSKSWNAPAALLAALYATCRTCSHPKGRCLLVKPDAAEHALLVCCACLAHP